MEEGGHYYTVYYTSLAVGFKEPVAYRHAVLSQMPDEVLWLDAAHMQTQQCKGTFGNRFISLGKETDLDGVERYVPADERYRVQYGLHALPGRSLNENTRSSAYQRRITAQMLQRESPVSLKFGMLLHRLGDTYAHSRMDNDQTMYTVTETDKCFTSGHYTESFGHLFHMHDPDYPFLRQNIFFSYLEHLYEVLLNKVRERGSAPYRRNVRPRPFHEVRGDFQIMFMRLTQRVQRKMKQDQEVFDEAAKYSGTYVAAREAGSETKAKWFIEEIRDGSLRVLKIPMRKYSPENEEGMSLQQFLGRHPELNDLNINSRNLNNAMNGMLPRNARGGATGTW
ncbi:MAG: hypothetical protein JNM68_11015 [Dinghuibacter sp.]|nr:hypothetical protein [Dinghuibacter sp.]